MRASRMTLNYCLQLTEPANSNNRIQLALHSKNIVLAGFRLNIGYYFDADQTM